MIGRNFWDITPIFEGKPPKPKQKIKCPICGKDKIFFKSVSCFCRYPGQYRIDISVKCGRCALVITFGVHITEEEFEKLKGVRFDYRQVGHININEL